MTAPSGEGTLGTGSAGEGLRRHWARTPANVTWKHLDTPNRRSLPWPQSVVRGYAMATVSIAEAAQRLGVSEKTIRRRLGGGALRGERISRPQGYTWAVHLDEDVDRRSDSAGRRRVPFWYGRWTGSAPRLRQAVPRPLAYAVVGLSLAALFRGVVRRRLGGDRVSAVT